MRGVGQVSIWNISRKNPTNKLHFLENVTIIFVPYMEVRNKNNSYIFQKEQHVPKEQMLFRLGNVTCL